MLIKVVFIVAFILTVSVTVFPAGADQALIVHRSVSVNTQQDSQQPPKSGNVQPCKNKNSSESFKATLEQPSSQPQNQKAKPDGAQNHHWYEIFLDHLVEWFLVLFSGLLVLFTYRLWKANVSLWKEAQEHSKQMRVSLTISEKAAYAAKDSVEVATNTLILTRRAFVFLKQITAEPGVICQGLQGPKEGHKWIFSPCWVNAGDTPTKNLTISVNSKVFLDEIPTADDFTYADVKDIPMVIGPRGAAVVGAFAIPYAIIKPLQGSQSDNLYIWGEARYHDIFGNQHLTRFCLKMLFLTQQLFGEHNEPTFVYYDRYNCSDEDCAD